MKPDRTLNRVTAILLFFLSPVYLFSQSLAINSTGNLADTSAILDVSSTSKGLLIPRVSLTSLTTAGPINNPATSLLVYNTNTSLTGGKGYYYNSGTSVSPVWEKLVTQTDSIVKSSTPSGTIVALDRFPMGELSMNGNATATNIAQAGTYYKVAGATNFSSGSYQFSNGGTSNRLVYTGTKMKMFHIACTLSVSASQSNQVVKAVLYKNGSPLSAGIVQTKLGGTGDITSTAIHVMTEMSQNDYLELYIMNVSGAYTLTITEMNLFAMGVSMGMD